MGSVTVATCLWAVDKLSKTKKRVDLNAVNQLLQIENSGYDMSTRLWNIAKSGLLKKEKPEGKLANFYTITEEGTSYLIENKDTLQKPGTIRMTIKAVKPRKKKEPTPPQADPALSQSATQALDEMSILLDANDKMNIALEKVEEILSDLLDEIDINAISVDVLGMPLIDAQKRKWKGLFASIAKVVFDNALTHTQIRKFHAEIDETLRAKYGEQNKDKDNKQRKG